jgi:hypothetical protein
MQVQRLHSSQPPAGPVLSRKAGSGNASHIRPQGAQEDAPAEAGSTVGVLSAQLGEIPEVRQAVVDEAREKVAAGDYLTRSSAEATAEALLRHES